jgi:hypothetical protein
MVNLYVFYSYRKLTAFLQLQEFSLRNLREREREREKEREREREREKERERVWILPLPSCRVPSSAQI